MKYLLLFTTLCISTLIVAQQTDLVKSVEQAHHKTEFLAHDAIQFDIVLSFGGRELLNSTLTLSTDSSNAILESKDGDKVYVNSDRVYHNPNKENVRGVRSSAYTWSYFFLFPYKLSDGGKSWSDYSKKELNGTTYNVEKLTFAKGTGDAPDDWYIMYADKETNLVTTSAYIATGGKAQKKSEEKPHAITYNSYQIISGIPIAHEWTFWSWDEEKGITKQLGEASLKNIKFVDTDDEYFAAPANYLMK